MLQSQPTPRASDSRTDPAFAFRTRSAEALPIQARVERARRLPRPAHGPLPLVSLMAARLLDHHTGFDACTDEALRRDGFRADEIKRHGEAARDIAAGRIVQRLLDAA